MTPRRAESLRWTEDQDRMIVTTLKMSPAHATAAVNKVGPCRTIRAVETRRRDLRRRGNLPRPTGNAAGVLTTWTTLPGGPEARDRKFVRILMAAQLGKIRAIRASVGAEASA